MRTCLAKICWGRSTCFFVYDFFCFKWSVKKHCAAKILQGIWERFLQENNYNVTIILTILVTNSPLSLFYLFIKAKTRIKCSACWWCGNEKYSCFLFTASCAKGMPNSIYFYKMIFLHVTPARIIIPRS